MKNKFLLPILSGVLLIIAILVIVFVPQEDDKSSEQAAITEESTEPDVTEEIKSADGSVKDLIINKDELTESKLSIYKYSDDSKLEIVAAKVNGEARVALGTCQSCNGAPGAYYTQNGELLQCNNCGLTFPMSVIGGEGSGCNLISIEPSYIKEDDQYITIKADYLLKNEYLFDKVEKN